MKNSILILFLCLYSLSFAQQKPHYKVHAHNDYAQEFPFWEAYIGGASSIEVDVFLKENTLFVTHSENEIKKVNTLEKLYLQPLKQLQTEGRLRNLQLLIDLKQNNVSVNNTDLLRTYRAIDFN